MGKQATIDEQANTPVQGTEGGAEPIEKSTGAVEKPAALLVAETPEWVKTILDSNAAVIESNQKVIDAFESLGVLAGEFAGEIPAKTEKEVNLTATYVVAEGKSFRDSKDFDKVFSEGDSVGGLDEDRLKHLLNQGIIEEA